MRLAVHVVLICIVLASLALQGDQTTKLQSKEKQKIGYSSSSSNPKLGS
jgi:hypothetical protein